MKPKQQPSFATLLENEMLLFSNVILRESYFNDKIKRRMNMAYVLQVDFKMNGPFGDEMADAFSDLAKSINEEEGFLWKIWTENPQINEAGGIYIFETRETAENYIEMHSKRLAGFGISEVNAKIFAINSKLTEITKGPVK